MKEWFTKSAPPEESLSTEQVDAMVKVQQQDWDALADIADLYADLRTVGLFFGESDSPTGDNAGAIRMMSGKEVTAIIEDMIAQKSPYRIKELPSKLQRVAARLVSDYLDEETTITRK